MMFFLKVFFLLFIQVSLVYSSSSIKVTESQIDDKPSSLISLSTSLGELIGYKQNVVNKIINVFLGIPFAEPPVGNLRFKRTKLISKFPTNPYLATDIKPHCILKDSSSLDSNQKYSEDCLFMNLWTPNIEEYKSNETCSRKFSVIIYVASTLTSVYKMSSFVDANNSTTLYYNGELFPALHDTIFVTFSLRSSIMSELVAKDMYEGNLHLFDTNLAIQWIHNHIKFFCGDANDLTLAGHSAGGLVASMNLISNYSKPLINKAILMSGVSMFSIDRPISKNQALVFSFKVFNEVNCLDIGKSFRNIENLNKRIKGKYFTISNQRYLLKKDVFLRELEKNFKGEEIGIKDKIDLIEKNSNLNDDFLKLIQFLSKHIVDSKCLAKLDLNLLGNLKQDFKENFSRWSLYYDDDFIDRETYLDFELFNKFNFNPNLKLLVGNVEDEDVESISLFTKSDKYYTDQFNPPVIPKEDVMELLKKTFYNITLIEKDNDTFYSEASGYYSNEGKWSLKRGYIDAVFNAVNDLKFFCPHNFYIYYGSMTAKSVYSYFITQRATKHHGSIIKGVDAKSHTWLKITHGDDLIYTFGIPFRAANQFTDLDRKFSLQLIELWANFAKEGKMPRLSNGKEWPVSTKEDNKPKYVEVNSNFLREKKFEFEERCEKFWRPKLPYYKN